MKKIIVIGGGLMGCSVAWKLVEQGAEVSLLEQQGKQYEHGSSFGKTRITRSLGAKKDIYSYVHNQTIKEVKNLLAFLNERSLGEEHLIGDIYNTSPVSYVYSKDQYSEIQKLRHKKQRKDYRKASGDAAFRKFGISLEDDQVLVREYRQYSGTMNPEALIQKLRLGIARKGGQLKYNTKVVRLVKKDGSFELTLFNTKTKRSKTIRAEKVVVAAGAYSVQVLQDFAPYFNKIITPKRILLAYFKIAQKRYKTLSDKEIKNILAAHPMFSQVEKEYFSMIEEREADSSPLFKVGGHQMRHNILDLDQVWTLNPHKRALKYLKKQFRKQFEMLEIFLNKKEIELVETRNCVYSVTKTKEPLVTPIFNKFGSLDKNIVVIGGMSGIGAKGCLGYGLIGANLILGKAGESSKLYKKAIKTFANPSVRLHTKGIKRGHLF